MADNLFKNDRITGNSKIGFNFKGHFKDDENILTQKLKDVLNRNVMFSNIDYKLMEPTDERSVLIKDRNMYEVKTPMYSYFEAMFVLPKILEFLKSLKEYKNSYLYFRFGFNKDFCDISMLNITKFILEFNEDYVLKHLVNATSDGSMEKLTDIKPENIDAGINSIQKQLDGLKFIDDDSAYGIDFNTLKLGYITFKYAQDINYRNKWEEINKCINHTLITLYNTSMVSNFTDDEIKKLDKINSSNKEMSKIFGCYELFKDKFPNIKITKDLDTDNAQIDLIFPSIKDKLFDLIVRNGIRQAEINYDSDISRLQLKGIEIKKCYHLSGVDIVEGELENCSVHDCDIYDTKIDKSSIRKCNIFGYANCKESKFKDCFISRNIQLKDCSVTGSLGKMGGSMKGGELKNTSVITSMAEIDNDVEKTNVNEIQ